MINLFIDTNRYLSLYGFSKDKLEEIQKVIDSIKKGKIILWLPEQVINEFRRNRERIPLEKVGQIKKAAFSFKCSKLPDILGLEDKMDHINRLFEGVAKIGNEINSRIEEAVELMIQELKRESLPADAIIIKMFEVARTLKYDSEIINRARTRYDLGIPPGKGGSYGDAVIWETLLIAVPNKETLDFVGFDKDFKSAIDAEDFSPFLLKEWKEKKGAEIVSYEHLGEFIKKRIPEIERPDKITEEEKRLDKKYLLTTSAWFEAEKGILNTVEEFRRINIDSIIKLHETQRQDLGRLARSINIEQLNSINNYIERIVKDPTIELMKSYQRGIMGTVSDHMKGSAIVRESEECEDEKPAQKEETKISEDPKDENNKKKS